MSAAKFSHSFGNLIYANDTKKGFFTKSVKKQIVNNTKEKHYVKNR